MPDRFQLLSQALREVAKRETQHVNSLDHIHTADEVIDVYSQFYEGLVHDLGESAEPDESVGFHPAPHIPLVNMEHMYKMVLSLNHPDLGRLSQVAFQETFGTNPELVRYYHVLQYGPGDFATTHFQYVQLVREYLDHHFSLLSREEEEFGDDLPVFEYADQVMDPEFGDPFNGEENDNMMDTEMLNEIFPEHNREPLNAFDRDEFSLPLKITIENLKPLQFHDFRFFFAVYHQEFMKGDDMLRFQQYVRTHVPSQVAQMKKNQGAYAILPSFDHVRKMLYDIHDSISYYTYPYQNNQLRRRVNTGIRRAVVDMYNDPKTSGAFKTFVIRRLRSLN